MAHDITLKDLDTILMVDKHALDEENIQHPMMVYAIGCAWAAAKAAVDRAEQQKVVLAAEIEEKLRSTEEGKKLGVEPMKAKIRLNSDIRDLSNEIIDLQEEADKWAAAVKAIDAKGYDLRELGALDARNYYARESTNVRDAKTSIADRNKQAAGQLRRAAVAASGGRAVREND